MDKARLSTYDDYRALPESTACQLLRGELVMSPAPNLRHAAIVLRIASALHAFVQERGAVYAAPVDVILSRHDVVQPDVIYVSEARRGELSPEGVRGAPDLCVEVVSPASRETDRGLKRRMYARHGVREYWIVDPDEGTVEVHRFEESAAAFDDSVAPFEESAVEPAAPVERLGRDGVLETPLLPGFALELAAVFRE